LVRHCDRLAKQLKTINILKSYEIQEDTYTDIKTQ